MTGINDIPSGTHWIARDEGAGSVVVIDRDVDARLRYYRDAGWTVEGPFVRAGAAVALLREAERSMTWHPSVPVGRRSRWASDVEALDV